MLLSSDYAVTLKQGNLFQRFFSLSLSQGISGFNGLNCQQYKIELWRMLYILYLSFVLDAERIDGLNCQWYKFALWRMYYFLYLNFVHLIILFKHTVSSCLDAERTSGDNNQRTTIGDNNQKTVSALQIELWTIISIYYSHLNKPLALVCVKLGSHTPGISIFMVCRKAILRTPTHPTHKRKKKRFSMDSRKIFKIFCLSAQKVLHQKPKRQKSSKRRNQSILSCTKSSCCVTVFFAYSSYGDAIKVSHCSQRKSWKKTKNLGWEIAPMGRLEKKDNDDQFFY